MIVSIEKIQEEITSELSLLNSDSEMTLFYIVRLGQHLPPMPVAYKTQQYLLKGCHSKVWLNATMENNRVYFYADSDTLITKGIMSLLLRVLNGQAPDAILQADLNFIQKGGFDRFIGSQHSHGFAMIIKYMKQYALNFA